MPPPNSIAPTLLQRPSATAPATGSAQNAATVPPVVQPQPVSPVAIPATQATSQPATVNLNPLAALFSRIGSRQQ